MNAQIYTSAMSEELDKAGLSHTINIDKSLRNLVSLVMSQLVVKVANESTPLEKATYKLFDGDILIGSFEAPQSIVKRIIRLQH
ncbi:hypothetical protein CJF42_06115 [Pseudoalteromonas sp. NBT06-2]|nr:hypothetical protein CJF42_06115 [Pseudoalteromonas sp. NBT06-2]